MKHCLSVLGLAVGLAIRTLAHSVWIEPVGPDALGLRFAEPDGRLERSPGHLDDLDAPVAWRSRDPQHPGATNAIHAPPPLLPLSKQPDHFRIGSTTPSDSIQVETAYPVLTSPGRPGRRPVFYARWHPASAGPATPALTLDLVPTGKPGQVQAWFRGKPLPGAKALFRTPDEKEREVVADAQGFFILESGQSGLHLLSIARHRENLPGFAHGQPFELTSHNTTLSWRAP